MQHRVTFFSAFLRMLAWSPRQAFGALYWQLTGRSVRARNRLRIAAAQAPFAYELWIKTVERLEKVVAGAPAAAATWQRQPRFSVLVHHDPAAPAKLDRIRAMLGAQVYAAWELVVVADPALPALPVIADPRVRIVSTTEPALSFTRVVAAATGDFVLPLPAGAVLPPTALYHYAEALQDTTDTTVLFGDHDRLDACGARSRPWFKPRWNPEMFLAQDYVSDACAIDAAAARAAGDCGTAYELLLAISADPAARFVHVPHIQASIPEARERRDQAARIAAVERHVAASGATVLPAAFGTIRVQWPLPAEPPLVSIIVPTRDKAKLLATCIDGVLAETNYRNFEILIVDNGSVEQATFDYLDAVSRDARVRVLRYGRPYNYSSINNFAADQARGAYLCLLNNDTEVIDPDWLSELMRYAVRPEVGAVGAKLFYEDRTIQHAGVTIGLGEAAGHAHRFLSNDDEGYFRYAHVAHRVSAVTAACLVVERGKFEAVGGLDGEHLQIAFNDVDLCLKLERAGWHNVYTPYAMMIHHESKSRGSDVSPQHIERYLRELGVLQTRWNTKSYVDPLHHPSLDRSAEHYLIRLP